MNFKIFKYIYPSAIILLFFSVNTYAQKWLCHETASMRYGNKILTCGVGEAKTESLARSRALDSAKKEFDQICEEDLTCKDFKTRVEPQRNSCSFQNDLYKCYRGLEYEITDIKKEKVDLAKVEDELEKKKKEYELAKEKYEKKKEIDEINQKLKEEDFSEEPSDWNHFFHIGGQLSASSGTGTEFAIAGFSAAAFLRYIPKQRWGVQLKHYNLSLRNNDLEQLTTNAYSDTRPLKYSASGGIDSFSLIYYFNNLEVGSGATAFLGFGSSTFDNKYSYSYLNVDTNQMITDSGKAKANAGYVTVGYSSADAFSKSGEMGYEFGLDYYNFSNQDEHYLSSIVDLYIGFIWGY